MVQRVGLVSFFSVLFIYQSIAVAGSGCSDVLGRLLLPQRAEAVQKSQRAVGALIQIAESDPVLSPRVRENKKDEAAIASNGAKAEDPKQQTRAELVATGKVESLTEPLVDAALFELQSRSLRLEEYLRANQGSKAELKRKVSYDVLFIGAGVHETIAQNVLFGLDGTPNRLKSLTVERTNLVASTFAKAESSFSINSVSRPNDVNELPKPGKNNLNQFPDSPVQVPDLYPNRFPPARSISDVATLNRFSLENDMLFEYSVDRVEDLGVNQKSPQGRYRVSLTSEKTGKRIVVFANTIVNAAGIGETLIPIKSASTQRLIDEVREATPAGELPAIASFREVIDYVGGSENPYRPFVDQKIGIVGSGDSAKVFIEFLLRIGPQAAYKNDTAQLGYFDRISWFGVDAKDCQDYLLNNRVRYSGIAVGIKNESIDLIQEKVVRISRTQTGKYEVLYVKGGKERTVTLDRVVFATGFASTAYKILEPIVGKADAQGQAWGPRNPIEDKLDVISGMVGDKKAKIAKKLPGNEIYWIGPSAGKLAPDNELKGVPQNFVSIFATGPRTAQFTRDILGAIQSAPFDPTPTAKAEPIALLPSRNPTEILGFYLSKEAQTKTASASDRLLASLLVDVLNDFVWPSGEQLKLSVSNKTNEKTNELWVELSPGTRKTSSDALASRLYENDQLLRLLSDLSVTTGQLEFTFETNKEGKVEATATRLTY